MNILIFGGNRNFGKLVLKKLLEKKHKLFVVNRNTKKKNLTHKNLTNICCDRKELYKFRHLLGDKKFDVIFDNIAYNLVDVKETLKLLDGKISHYIFTSSIITYLSSNYNFEVKEKDWLKGKLNKNWIKKHNYKKIDLNYAKNKRAIEKHLIKNKKISYTILRLPNVIGKNDFSKKTERLIAYPFNKFNKKINSEDYIQFIYKPDLVKIIVKIIENKIFKNQIYNIANEKVRIKYFYKKIKELKNYSKNKYKKYIDFDFPMPINSLMNIDKVKNKLKVNLSSLDQIIKSLY